MYCKIISTIGTKNISFVDMKKLKKKEEKKRKRNHPSNMHVNHSGNPLLPAHAADIRDTRDDVKVTFN